MVSVALPTTASTIAIPRIRPGAAGRVRPRTGQVSAAPIIWHETLPLGDLAPRDVVAKQMSRVMAEQGVDHLYLDARSLGEELLRHRFPTFVAN
ncbi:MAG: FAD-binding protein, partial [Geminicoccaceae bacterium]